MPRDGELTYFENIGEAGRKHALLKPFSDEDCGIYLQRIGALFSLLPTPPARILECGCGTGWLSYLLTKRGYKVVATDVAPEAIRLARNNPMFRDEEGPEFIVMDTENLEFKSSFEAVVFFDSLHHAVDELAALRSAFQALRPGGLCIALEPGRGHHKKSLDVESTHDVTEKDMPPSYIWQLGRKVGFKNCQIYPAPQYLAKALYIKRFGWQRWLWKLLPLRIFIILGILMLQKWTCGITVLCKPLDES